MKRACRLAFFVSRPSHSVDTQLLHPALLHQKVGENNAGTLPAEFDSTELKYCRNRISESGNVAEWCASIRITNGVTV